MPHRIVLWTIFWTSFGATDMPKSAVKDFRAPWIKDGYQGLRAADPGALGRG